MSSNALSLTAADNGGTLYQVDSAPTSGDTANLRVQEWSPDNNPQVGAPDTDNTYPLTAVKVSGDVVNCMTSSFFGQPWVTITLGAASVEIAVSHIMFAPKPTTLPLDAKLVAQARAWLAASPFPKD